MKNSAYQNSMTPGKQQPNKTDAFQDLALFAPKAAITLNQQLASKPISNPEPSGKGPLSYSLAGNQMQGQPMQAPLQSSVRPLAQSMYPQMQPLQSQPIRPQQFQQPQLQPQQLQPTGAKQQVPLTAMGVPPAPRKTDKNEFSDLFGIFGLFSWRIERINSETCLTTLKGK
jgi:hypothetical protein